MAQTNKSLTTQTNNKIMTTEEIRALLNDIESDRVERTISTTNTDKFGQAICAFANDLPDHRQPGYLFLGVGDNGSVKGLNVTDEMLKNVAAIRSRGVIRVQKELKANDNGEAVYDFSYQTAVMVTEMKSLRGEKALKEAVVQGFVTKNGERNGLDNNQRPSKKPSKKPSKMKVPMFPTPIVEEVYKAIKLNRKAKYSWLQDNLGISESTVLRAIKDLKELGYINKEHSKVKGEWQLLK